MFHNFNFIENPPPPPILNLATEHEDSAQVIPRFNTADTKAYHSTSFSASSFITTASLRCILIYPPISFCLPSSVNNSL
jgi:hypothetical protein